MKRIMEWAAAALWSLLQGRIEEQMRAIAQEEDAGFYLWAVIHGGISVPLMSYEAPRNEYERWAAMVYRAKAVMGRTEVQGNIGTAR